MGENYYNLTAPQKSIWLTEQYYKNTNINNVCGTFYSNECLNFETLKKALNIFLQNNDSFKIKLHFTEDKVSQYFSELNNIDFPIVDIKTKEEQTSLEEKLASKVFSMLDSLLFEIVLFRYPDNHGGFVINSHHIISDSWTNGIVANDVALIYSKVKNNEIYEKSENLSYKNYISSEEDYVQSEKFQKDKKYWNDLFATIPEVATIPSIKDTFKNQDDLNAKRMLLNLDKELFKSLKEYCDRNKVSFYNFFMTIFSLYLGRVSNLDEFVIGTPILNRTNFKEKQTTGMFINTLPLKITLSHEKTFLENLKDIAVNSMSLLRHQKYSYQYLIEDLRKRDSNLPMLYKVAFSYQITKMNENMDALNHTTSWTFNNTIADDLDIHMFEWNENNSIQIAYDYRTNKYDEQDISDLHARILHVINQILDNENILLKDIEIVTPEEKHKILYEFNNTKVDYPKDKTIVDLFEEQVEKTPDNIAVVFEDQQLTYKELNEKANTLARILINNNVSCEDIVGVCLPRGIELIISIFAILKCGAAYMPMYTGYPKDRLAYMLSNSNSKLIITNNNFISLIDIDNILNLDDINLNNKTSFERSTYTPDSLAYIIYTSGSTGKPKGVKISHKNLINFIYSFNQYYNNITSKDSFLASTNIAFDVSIWEIFMPLLNGAKLVFNTEEIISDITLYCNNITKNNISALYIPPNILNEVYTILNNNKYTKIEKLLVGVESITNTTLNKYIMLNPNITIVNGYGPTETTICATAFIYKKDTTPTHPVSIGKPLNNNNIYILSNNQLCPINTPGELYISGDGVGMGYINDEEKTKTSFIENPFCEGKKMYSSGDIAYIGSDNNLYFIGRKDNQIKINGYRIELSEIDCAINNYPLINKSLSVLYNNSIISYYISDEDILINDIKTYLKDKLPFYMIPSFYIRLESFPLTVNGKIDKKRLPSPILNSNKGYTPPSSNTEKILHRIWCELFNKDKISVTDNFFDLGGDSLTAIKLSVKVLENFNINISLENIFNNSTIETLSKYIDSLIENRFMIKIKEIEKESYYPISSAQKRIYYSSSLENNSTLYNIAGGIIVDKLLDVNKLQECFNILINRHESLRTHFDIINDEVVQVIDDNIDFELPLEDVNSDDLNKIYHDFVKPFDLSKSPLFRCKLIKLKDDKMLLLLDMHHIISDGTSLSILLQELCDLYNGLSLPEKHIDYKDFTLWEKDQFETDEFNKSKKYWLNQFNDEIPLLNMPTTSPRPSIQSFEGSNYHTKLSKDIFERINKTAKTLNITPYMLMLSAYYILLSKYTSQDDIVIGTPIVGRELPELSNILGMFVNTLALRNKIDHNLTFEEFSKSIKKNCLNSFKNQSYPFDMLVKDLNIKRDTSRNPLFDVMFVYQNNGYQKIDFKGTNVEYFIPDNNISKFDLTLEVIPTDNEYSLRFEYCTKLFNEDFIKRLSSHYINILTAILENNEIKIADIDMLSEEEKNQILYEFNNTKVDYPKDKTIIDLFEEQVKKTPDNIAVIFEDQKLTYRELNEKANQLANHLIINNISDNSIVGIMLDRSLEILVSFLAVLKTGACYMPIDPSFPLERIKYMLSNSDCSVLLKKSNINFYDFDNIINIDIAFSDIYITDSSKNINKYINSANRAYIIYTSGSTGKPKGVILKHKSLLNLTNYLNKNVEYLKNNKPISILSLTTISFDIFIFETLISLQKGLTVVIANEKEQSNPTLLLELINKFNIKALQMTPSRMKIFVNNNYIDTFKNIKYITLAGEALSKDLRDRLLKIDNITIYNGYGPSETTVYSTFTNATKQSTITIGVPIDNTFIYILDKNMHLCPIGVPGEIYISGDGVGYGYLNNKDLTNKVFIQDKFSPGNVMYKSGDLACYLPNGELNYLGRNDHQVKIRGLRIELDEIIRHIKNFPDVKDVIVSSSADTQGRKSIVAYLLINNRISINKLKQYLGKYIPNYMIPSHFIILDNFPYLPNGKIDKKSLPSPNIQKQTASYVSPRNKLELELINSMERLLSTYPIGIDDDFFNIGGDSLLAMSLQLDLLNKNIKIEYADIFINPTVRELANSISKKTESNNTYDMSSFEKYKPIFSQTITFDNTCLKYNKINNILLTGVTGFLGAHILDALLKHNCNKIYCLIRPDNGISIESKVINKLHYYFGTTYDHLLGNQIIPVISDMTQPNLGLDDFTLNMLSNNVDIIINSAAKVQHYGDISDYKKVNIDITKNLANFAQTYKKKFYHISTMSISGNTFADQSFTAQTFKDDIIFKENDFYIGQNLSNVYVRSKFEAEKIVFDKILEGLDGYVLRVGNLMNRFSDLKFQQNLQENAYINRLISFSKIKYIPEYITYGYLEFTPVDSCADSIIHIIEYPCSSNRIFHLFNHNTVDIPTFINIFNNSNKKINIVDEKTFIRNIDKIIKSKNSDILSGIINDFDENRKLIYESKIKLNSDFTINYLENINFKWPIISETYLNKFLKYFLN